jgi:tRNA U34 5-methylaminomethyl-2-thiouridine-forming methyltransferase MnmC
MKKIITADHSESFLNEEVGEAYHSFKGAIEEAEQKYVIPCKIRELATTGKLTILDVCFGLGYNSAKAIEEALKINPDCQIEVVGLEYDPKIVEKIQEVTPPLNIYKLYKTLNPRNLEVTLGNVKVTLILGDARETSKQLQQEFDAIFFDPFSPKSSPEMWSCEFFTEMCRVLKKAGILSTYSCARMARDNMAAAGLVYDDGPTWGRRGPGTIATKWE